MTCLSRALVTHGQESPPTLHGMIDCRLLACAHHAQRCSMKVGHLLGSLLIFFSYFITYMFYEYVVDLNLRHLTASLMLKV